MPKELEGKKEPSGEQERTPPKRRKWDRGRILSIGLPRPDRPAGAPKVDEDPWRIAPANGHFDRLFFALCARSHEVVRLEGLVTDFDPPHTQYDFFHDTNGPMSISELFIPANIRTQRVVLFATLYNPYLDAEEYREYDADIVQVSRNENEFIECAVFGLAVHDVNGRAVGRPFGTLFGSSDAEGNGGRSYGLPDELMFF